MAEGFKLGEAFVEVGLRKPTPADEEKVRKDTETDLGKNPPKIPTTSAPPTSSDQDKTRRKSQDDYDKKPPVKIPTTLRDPVDAAFRARLNSELQAAAKTLAGIPINPDTEQFRKDTAAKVAAITKTLSADIPLDVADAAKWRAKVTAEVNAVSESVQARIPVVVDEHTQQQSTASLRAWAIGAAAIVGPTGAVGGALLGTTALLGGLGAAAVKGDEQVTAAFGHLRDTVVADTKALAAPLVPVLGQVAKQTETTFRGMEDDIGRAFDEVAPQVADLSSGVLDLARNALPGLTGALHASSPVVSVLSEDLGGLGKSVSGFLTGLSSGSGGAAQGIHALLSDVDAILPPLGRFLGAAANLTGEIVSNFTPAFRAAGDILDGVTTVLDHTDGALAPLATSVIGVYTAWKSWSGIVKIADTIEGTVTSVTGGVKGLKAGSELAEKAIGGVTAATSTMSLATGGVILLLSGLALAYSKVRREEKSFADQAKDVASGLVAGGREADTAARKVARLGDALRLESQLDAQRAEDTTRFLALQSDATQKTSEHLGDLSSSLGINAKSQEQVTKAIGETRTALNDQLESLHATPRATQLINESFDAYVDAAKRHGSGSDQARTALDILNGQIDKVTTSTSNLDSTMGDTSGIDETTSAADALDQSLRNVVLASSSLSLQLQRQQTVEDAFAADISLRQAIDGTRQAQQNLNDTVKRYGPHSAEAKQATDGLLASMEGQARAAQNAAQANYTGTDATEKAKVGAKAYRDTLAELAKHADGPLKEALLGTIGRLDEAAKPRVTDLEADITDAEEGIAKAKAQLATVPASKQAKIKADIADLQHKAQVARSEIASITSKTIGLHVNVIVHGPKSITIGSVVTGLGITANATGSIALPRTGGQIVQVAEAGSPEGIIPLNDQGARFLASAVGPAIRQYLADRVPSTPAGVGVQPVQQTVYVQVNANQLSDMQRVVGLFGQLQQVARAGGVFA
jgi:hypothetical protein